MQTLKSVLSSIEQDIVDEIVAGELGTPYTLIVVLSSVLDGV